MAPKEPGFCWVMLDYPFFLYAMMRDLKTKQSRERINYETIRHHGKELKISIGNKSKKEKSLSKDRLEAATSVSWITPRFFSLPWGF